MDAREHLDLGRQGADVREPTTVDADLVPQDALAHELLLHAAVGSGDFLLTAEELALGPALVDAVGVADQLKVDGRLQLVDRVLALLLAGDRKDRGELALARRGGLDCGIHIVLVVEEDRELLDRLRGLCGEVGLGLAQRADERLGRLETLRDDLLGRGLLALGLDEIPGGVGGLGLDHHDRDIVTDDAAGDDHVEGRTRGVGEVGEGDPLAVDEGDADAADRAGKGQTGDLRRRGGGVDGHDVVLVVRLQRQHGDDDLDLIAQALDEGRAQRPVDQAAGQDRLGRGASLAAEEAARDLAEGIHALLDIDGQREEVELVFRRAARGRRRQQHGLAVEVGADRATRLTGEATGLEPDGAGAEAAVVDDGLGELDLWTLHGPSLSLSTSATRIVVVRGLSFLAPLSAARYRQITHVWRVAGGCRSLGIREGAAHGGPPLLESQRRRPSRLISDR